MKKQQNQQQRQDKQQGAQNTSQSQQQAEQRDDRTPDKPIGEVAYAQGDEAGGDLRDTKLEPEKKGGKRWAMMAAKNRGKHSRDEP